MYAPIALFVYKRVEKTAETVEALVRNREAALSNLFVFSDAPRGETDKEEVAKVRRYISGIIGFKSVEIIYREKNYGLAQNITQGVTQLVNHYGKIIVVEDDIVSSPFFLQYMNQALDLYRNNERVMCISAFSFFDLEKKGLPECFFIQGKGECWGWATWKRAWNQFEKKPHQVVKNMTISGARKLDQFGGVSIQIISNYLGKMNTWAAFWTYTIFRHKGLTLFPSRSLVQNSGMDGTGENFTEDIGEERTVLRSKPIVYFPKIIEEEKHIREILISEFNDKWKTDPARRVVRRAYWLIDYCKSKLKVIETERMR